jgi:hypothetical protein
MASRKLLREKFEALQTEEERVKFCFNLLRDLWDRDELQKELLPEAYAKGAIKNMKGALEDSGRSDLWERFERAVARMAENYKKGRPDYLKQFFREVLGEFYRPEHDAAT